VAPVRSGFDPATFSWDGVPARAYKPNQGEVRGMSFKGVTRRTLAKPDDLPASFEVRYFEFEPGGYSSLERHEHPHFVVVIRGSGRALVGTSVVDLAAFDTVHVPPMTPHRWINPGDAPFGFLCTVDRDRDRPQPISDAEVVELRAHPATAPYVF
jgi:quercetin dioxygenase-like cupin family protein